MRNELGRSECAGGFLIRQVRWKWGDRPSKADRSLLLYIVLPGEFCAAITGLLHWVNWASVWAAMDLRWWATTLQFVGALIAAVLGVIAR